MSRHLRVLDADMVSDERTPEDARARIFRLRPESLVAVQAYLDQLQADWSTSGRRSPSTTRRERSLGGVSPALAAG